ncbi:MAG: hypothetical protein U0531_02765 [Dehalococcoidia bacterium]
MNATAAGATSSVLTSAASEEESLRCFECRRLWPRALMRWGARPVGPVWLPHTQRVLRCPDCLPA